MSSPSGLPLTQLFVGAAYGRGMPRRPPASLAYRARGQSQSPPGFAKLLDLVGIVLVTVLLTGALSGFFAWWVAAQLFPDPARDVRNFICFAPPLLLALYFAANALFIGLTSWFG